MGSSFEMLCDFSAVGIVAKHRQRELKKMLDSKVKLEIEALSRKGITFISEEYLPCKLTERDRLV